MRTGARALALVALAAACSEPSPREGTMPSRVPAPRVRKVRPAADAAVASPAPAAPDGGAPTAAADLDPPTSLPGSIEDPSGAALLPLYRALAALDAGQPARVGIVQLGDSLTAADFQTATMRARLQQRFGDAGRGFLLPGKPIKHYYLGDAAYGTEGSWDVEYGMKRTAIEPVGLGGVRIHSGSPKVSAWVGTCARCASGHTVSRIELWYRRTSDGGSLEITVDDGKPQLLATRLPAGAPIEYTATHVIEVPDGEHRVSLHPVGDGVVELFAVIMERAQPGVVLDAIGVVGAQATHLERWDWTWVAEQLARRQPALVVLAYGTNEMDDEELNLQRFEDRLVELVRRVRSAVPDAAVMIQGPPDRGKRALTRKECEKPLKLKKPKGKGKKPIVIPEGAVREGCLWQTPTAVPPIIEAERRAAYRAGAAFFDVYTAMGGIDRTDTFFRQEPKWFYKDHTHLAGPGGAWVANHLLDDLLSRYDAWRARSGLPEVKPAKPWPATPPLPPTLPPPTVVPGISEVAPELRLRRAQLRAAPDPACARAATWCL